MQRKARFSTIEQIKTFIGLMEPLGCQPQVLLEQAERQAQTAVQVLPEHEVLQVHPVRQVLLEQEVLQELLVLLVQVE
jgi:hypothetical protein